MDSSLSHNQALTSSNNNSVDLAKFICALLVVTIHNPICGFNINEGTGYLVNIGISHCLARLAVPFFFVTSAYFLFSKDNAILTVATKKTIRKLLKLYIIWTLVYSPFIIWNIVNSDSPIFELAIFIKDFFLVGSFYHLWYLPAALFAIAAVSLLLIYKVNIKTIMVIGMVLYVIGVFDDSWYGIMPDCLKGLFEAYNSIFKTTRNGLFDGIPFVSLGAYFAIIKPKVKYPVLGFSLSMCFLLWEAYYVTLSEIRSDNNIYLFLYPSIFFLFYLIVNAKLPDKNCYPILREMSSLIYFLHIIAGSVVSVAIRILKIGIIPECYFASVLILSIAISYAITLLAKYENLKWLKSLYS